MIVCVILEEPVQMIWVVLRSQLNDEAAPTWKERALSGVLILLSSRKHGKTTRNSATAEELMPGNGGW